MLFLSRASEKSTTNTSAIQLKRGSHTCEKSEAPRTGIKAVPAQWGPNGTDSALEHQTQSKWGCEQLAHKEQNRQRPGCP